MICSVGVLQKQPNRARRENNLFNTAAHATFQIQQYQHNFILSSFPLPEGIRFKILSSVLAVQSKLAI